MPEFEQKLCFGLLQLKQTTKNLTFLAKIMGLIPLEKPKFTIYTVFGFKM